MASIQNVAFDGFTRTPGSRENMLIALVAKIAGRLAAWKEERKTLNELNQLTDAQLRDIGIYRSDIPAVSKGLFGGRHG